MGRCHTTVEDVSDATDCFFSGRLADWFFGSGPPLGAPKAGLLLGGGVPVWTKIWIKKQFPASNCYPTISPESKLQTHLAAFFSSRNHFLMAVSWGSALKRIDADEAMVCMEIPFTRRDRPRGTPGNPQNRFSPKKVSPRALRLKFLAILANFTSAIIYFGIACFTAVLLHAVLFLRSDSRSPEHCAQCDEVPVQDGVLDVPIPCNFPPILSELDGQIMGRENSARGNTNAFFVSFLLHFSDGFAFLLEKFQHKRFLHEIVICFFF